MPRTRDRRPWNKAFNVVAKLKALPSDPDKAEEFLPEVAKLFGPDLDPDPEIRYEVFRMLDESPGSCSHEYLTWHWKLRRTRNHPVHGKAMFAQIRGEQV